MKLTKYACLALCLCASVAQDGHAAQSGGVGKVRPGIVHLNGHGVINGTGMSRSGMGTVAVGGPSTKMVGVNGTGTLPKH